MSVTCIVKYKESCKKLVVGGEKAAADVRTALLTSPFKDVVDNMLIQVKDKALNEFFDIDDTTVVTNGDIIRLVENPFLDLFARSAPLELDPDFALSPESPAVPSPVSVQSAPGPLWYKFPDFPINIAQEIEKTEVGKVMPDLRRNIIRQIVSSLCIETMYPDEHYLTAAQELVRRYPQLMDKSRTRCASWHAGIKNRARNVRKRMPAGLMEVDSARAKAKARQQSRRVELPGDHHSVPKKAVRNMVQATDCGPGEDEETINGQIEFMKKEMKKTVWDKRKVEDAMNRTYKARRAWLNGANLTVTAVTDRYPALTRAQEIRQEFRRLTGRDAEEGLDAFLERKTEELYKLFLMKAASKRQAKEILEYSKGCSQEESATLLGNGALLLLPCLMNEKSTSILKKLEPGTQHMNPCIVYVGEDVLTSPMYAVKVEELSIDVPSLKQAFSLLISLFWAFGIHYTPEAKNMLTILEHAIGVSHTKMGTVALRVWSSL
ncbi:uncharacterized protein LOC115325517 [Ixodes scapularis]|uniref:uncharacterized protein LOC115325517 n=1 Tax=Ixodes scapularis TaxID=6945 RepID=UPI001A9EC403|nr:uncharacterized protein LOC115325517 [Ixodes scapularis]